MQSLIQSHSLSKISHLSSLLQSNLSHPHLLQIQAQVFILGAHQHNLIATRLINHYPFHLALKVFDKLREPNIYPFNAIIGVLSKEGKCSLALSYFRGLKRRDLSPNGFTFCHILKGFLSCGSGLWVKLVHTQIVKVGLNCDPFVGNGLLRVYARGLKDMRLARLVFDEMLDKRMVCSWASLIAGHAKLGLSDEALRLFFVMVKYRLNPDNDTMVNVLSACAKIGFRDSERWIKEFSDYGNGLEPGNPGKDSVGLVCVYLYGKLERIEKSRESFDGISNSGKRCVIPWNAMIGAYVQNGCALEGLCLFRIMMEDRDIRPNHITMVNVLSACAQVGDMDLGMWVHEYMKSRGREEILKTNSNVATALIDMYSKCGNLKRAKEVFNNLVLKDVVSVNAMIMGLAVNGEGNEALTLFYKMGESGIHPNGGTFLGVLCACSHSGMVEKGREIFKEMKKRFSNFLQLEHYSCYIDLLARVGLIEEALEVVNAMPFEPNNFVWGALLGGCLLHSRIELSQDITKKLLESDSENSAGYVMLSNALAMDNHWGDIMGLRSVMRDKGVKKQPGISWISVNGEVHEFLVRPFTHPQIDSICFLLEGLVMQMKIGLQDTDYEIL